MDKTLYLEIADFIKSKTSIIPKIGIILGSGLGSLANSIEESVEIEYSEIPNFPVSTVEGHAGKLIFGYIHRIPVVAMKGRFHYYEGYSMNQVTLPVRVMKFLGIEYLFVSNAAGGLNPNYKTGDLMIIKDHINLFPEHPLRGKNDDTLGPRFPDMSKVYDIDLRQKAIEIGKLFNIKLHEGIYIGSQGPTLETPAEYRMFHLLGADATGMSTVPEIIVARHCDIKCFGISVITNESETPIPDGITTHEEVNTNAAAAEPRLTKIFIELIGSFFDANK